MYHVSVDYGTMKENEPVRDAIHTILFKKVSVGSFIGRGTINKGCQVGATFDLRLGKDTIVLTGELLPNPPSPMPKGIWGDNILRYRECYDLIPWRVYHEGIHPYDFCREQGIDYSTLNWQPNGSQLAAWASPNLRLEKPSGFYFDESCFVPNFVYDRKVQFDSRFITSDRNWNYYRDMQVTIFRLFGDGLVIKSQLYKKLNQLAVKRPNGSSHRWTYKNVGALLNIMVENKLLEEDRIKDNQMSLFSTLSEYKKSVLRHKNT